MNISGRTRITGIFGYPVEHTLSPAMHNAAFEDMGLDFCYIPFLVSPPDLRNAVTAIRSLNMRGVNITVPHKEKVIPLLDEVDEEARFIGAVNTVVNDGGKLIGFNTDGVGFMRSLEEAGISAGAKDVLVVGAGGAARAVGYYLCREAKSLTICGRTPSRAEGLAEDLRKVGGNVSSCNMSSDISRFGIVINATPLGLKDGDPAPFDTRSLRREQVVCDLVYRNTRLLEDAKAKGCSILNGSGMLLWQGVQAFELWTGKMPSVETMRGVLVKSIR